MKKLAAGIILVFILFARIDGIEQAHLLEISQSPAETGKTSVIMEGPSHEKYFHPSSWDILGEDLFEMFLHYRGVSLPGMVRWESFPVHDQDFEAIADKVHTELNLKE